MKVENLETAERFSKKRRTLSEVGKLLEAHVSSAEVIVRVNFGNKVKEASIQSVYSMPSCTNWLRVRLRI